MNRANVYRDVMPSLKRPQLALEMAHLGCVDPFALALDENPPGSGKFQVRPPRGADKPLSIERAGLCIAGASQALMDLSLRWFLASQVEERREDPPSPLDPPGHLGEMRMVVRRREARLLGSLLRRHVGRLPQPPKWMEELLRAIDEMDDFLRWQAD